MTNISDQQGWQHNQFFGENKENPKEKNSLYVHGSYMSLASELLCDKEWKVILKEQQLELYAKCDEIFKKHQEYTVACCKELMSAMEYSPVLAAFGTSKSSEKPVLELDLWLDKEEPGNLEKAKFIHGNLKSLIAVRSGFKSSLLTKTIFGSNVHKGLSPSKWFAIFNQSLMRKKEKDNPSENIAGVCLDIKSTYSSAEDIADFVKNFKRTTNIPVSHVGTFDSKQLEKLPEGTEPLLFFHSYQEIKDYKGTYKNLLFNGSNLITKSKDSDEFEVNEEDIVWLAAIAKQKKLKLGFYTQEKCASSKAIKALFDIVEKDPETFNLGFVYGSINNIAHKFISGDGKASQFVFMNKARRKNARKFVQIAQLFNFLNNNQTEDSINKLVVQNINNLEYISSQNAKWLRNIGFSKKDIENIKKIINESETKSLRSHAISIVDDIKQKTKKLLKINKLNIVIGVIALAAIALFVAALIVTSPILLKVGAVVAVVGIVALGINSLYKCKVLSLSSKYIKDVARKINKTTSPITVTR